MSFFALLIKLIPYIWPFIKEMLIGKKSWKQAFRENRVKTVMVVSLALSLLFNAILLTKVGHLAYNYLALSRAKQELEIKYKALDPKRTGLDSSQKNPLAAGTEVVTEIPKERKPLKEPIHQAAPADVLLAAEVKAEMERIRAREAAEHSN